MERKNGNQMSIAAWYGRGGWEGREEEKVIIAPKEKEETERI